VPPGTSFPTSAAKPPSVTGGEFPLDSGEMPRLGMKDKSNDIKEVRECRASRAVMMMSRWSAK
jgi:hypothetical protein